MLLPMSAFAILEPKSGWTAFDPIADVEVGSHNRIMIWWDWSGYQRMAMLAAMVALASLPWLMLGWLPQNWRAFIGGTSFLTIPQIVGWLLFVGLKTGVMPERGGKVERQASPIGFWLVAAAYGLVLVVYAWIIAMVLLDAVNGR